MMQATPRRAVVLFNLGGPDNLDAVRPFLFNLFNDPSIIRLPAFLRFPIAYLIARRRTPVARGIYEQLGGASPLLPNTEAQARALEAELADLAPLRVTIAMRYWHPMSEEAALDLRAWGAEEVLLLPLYPQFSTTTTASSLRVWRQGAAAAGFAAPTRIVCCYPLLDGFIGALTALIRPALAAAREHGRPRLLFSAHGLPERVVRGGDPYAWQCQQGAARIAEALGLARDDWVLCYQSRVGPMKWLDPSTMAEIRRAGADRVPVVVAPLAFVSEHSETLVELDIEYRHLAESCGVPHYARVAAPGAHPSFIGGLAELCRQAFARPGRVQSAAGPRLCPAQWSGCLMAGQPAGEPQP